MDFEFKGGKISLNEDGSAILETEDGRKFRLGADGTVNADLKSIKSVGVKNLIDLTGYTLMRKEGLIRHNLQFRNGGSATLAYEESGTLVEFKISGLETNITKESELTLSVPSNS